MSQKKRKHTGMGCVLAVDMEDGILIDFMWLEDYALPPIIIPTKEEADAKKKRRPS